MTFTERRGHVRPPKDRQLLVEAMVDVVLVECPWRCLPSVYGPWSSVYIHPRWRRGYQRRLWARLLALLARQAQGKLRFPDPSHTQVHQDASNPAHIL